MKTYYNAYYDVQNDLFLRERVDGSYTAYFPERHENVDLDDVDLSGLIKLT